jgi:hypothetical protein
MGEVRKRIDELLRLVSELRRIAKEYFILDPKLAKRLEDVVADLEREAAELEQEALSK